MKTVLTMMALLLGSAGFAQVSTAGLEKMVKEYIGQATSAASSKKEIVFNNRGSIFVPEVFSNKITGTKDSERGELTAPGSFIGYDIGFMAGTRVSAFNAKECSAYYNASVNGYNVWIGIKDGSLLVTLTNPDKVNVPYFPANFWSAVKNETEAKEVLAIALSYKPKQ